MGRKYRILQRPLYCTFRSPACVGEIKGRIMGFSNVVCFECRMWKVRQRRKEIKSRI